jgi:hypothetical protein
VTVRARAENESAAAQDQELQTKYCATKINSRCRLCQQSDHIISAYRIFVKEQYIKRHDTVCVLNYTSMYARKYG